MTEVRTKQSQFEEARLRVANKGRKSVPAKTSSKTLADLLDDKNDSSSSSSSSASAGLKKRASLNPSSLSSSSSSFSSLLPKRGAVDLSVVARKDDKKSEGMSGANKLALSLLIASILIMLGFNVDIFSPLVQFFVPYDPNDKDTAVFYLGNAVGSAFFWLAVIRYFTASSSPSPKTSSSSSSSSAASSAPQKLPRSDASVASAPSVADPKTPVTTRRGDGAGKTTPFLTKRPVDDGDETETDEESSTPLVRDKKSLRTLEFTPTPYSTRPARPSLNPMMHPIALGNNQNNQKAPKNVFPQRDLSSNSVARGFGTDSRSYANPFPAVSTSRTNVSDFQGGGSFSTFQTGLHDVENAYKPTKRRSTLMPSHMNHLQLQAPLPSSSSSSHLPPSFSMGTLANQFNDQRASSFGQQNQDSYFNQGVQGQFQNQYAPPHHFPPQMMPRQVPPANAFQPRPISSFQQYGTGPSPVAPRAQQPFYGQQGYGQQGYYGSSSSSNADPSGQISSMAQFNALAHGISSPYVPAKTNSPAVIAPTNKGSTDPNEIHPGLMDFVIEKRTVLLPSLLGFYMEQRHPINFRIPPYNNRDYASDYVWDRMGRILQNDAFEDTKPPNYPPDDMILLYWFLTVISAHLNSAFADRYVEKPDRSALSFTYEGQSINIGFQNKIYKFPGNKKDQLVNSINAFIFIYDKVLKKSPPISPVIFKRPL